MHSECLLLKDLKSYLAEFRISFIPFVHSEKAHRQVWHSHSKGISGYIEVLHLHKLSLLLGSYQQSTQIKHGEPAAPAAWESLQSKHSGLLGQPPAPVSLMCTCKRTAAFYIQCEGQREETSRCLQAERKKTSVFSGKKAALVCCFIRIKEGRNLIKELFACGSHTWVIISGKLYDLSHI